MPLNLEYEYVSSAAGGGHHLPSMISKMSLGDPTINTQFVISSNDDTTSAVPDGDSRYEIENDDDKSYSRISNNNTNISNDDDDHVDHIEKSSSLSSSTKTKKNISSCCHGRTYHKVHLLILLRRLIELQQKQAKIIFNDRNDCDVVNGNDDDEHEYGHKYEYGHENEQNDNDNNTNTLEQSNETETVEDDDDDDDDDDDVSLDDVDSLCLTRQRVPNKQSREMNNTSNRFRSCGTIKQEYYNGNSVGSDNDSDVDDKNHNQLVDVYDMMININHVVENDAATTTSTSRNEHNYFYDEYDDDYEDYTFTLEQE